MLRRKWKWIWWLVSQSPLLTPKPFIQSQYRLYHFVMISDSFAYSLLPSELSLFLLSQEPYSLGDIPHSSPIWEPSFPLWDYNPLWDHFGGGGSKITADGDCSHESKGRLPLGRKVMSNLDSILKSRDITLSTKVVFSSGHVWMWEVNYKESWMPKNWCILNCGVGEDSWESLGLQGDPISPS